VKVELELLREQHDFGIHSDLVNTQYPLHSKSWLLFYGPTSSSESENIEYEALILPEYNRTKIACLNPYEVDDFEMEMFYYGDNNYIMYLNTCSQQKCKIIKIYRQNMQPHQTLELKIGE